MRGQVLFAVEQDREGIRLAALEMLTESLNADERKRTERAAAHTEDPVATLAAAAPNREFACGYYVWLGYLFGLEAEISAGIHGTPTAADAVGLLALHQARAEFESEHPPCRCGRRLRNEAEKLQGLCRQCKDANA